MAENNDKTEKTEPGNDNLGTEETLQNESNQAETAKDDASTDMPESNADDEPQQESDPLEEAQQQIAQLKDQLLRTAAEFENYKKRTIREKADLIWNGGSKTVVSILPVLDDFERALADESDDPAAIREGVKMIFNKFLKSLESLGVKKMEVKDKDFDTDFHEAVAMVPGMGDDKKGKVIDCVQTGYTMNDKVIRHAKVAVAQ